GAGEGARLERSRGVLPFLLHPQTAQAVTRPEARGGKQRRRAFAQGDGSFIRAERQPLAIAPHVPATLAEQPLRLGGRRGGVANEVWLPAGLAHARQPPGV